MRISTYLLEPFSFPLFDLLVHGLPPRSLLLDLPLDLLVRVLLDLLKLGLEVLGLDGAGPLELHQLLVLLAHGVGALVHLVLGKGEREGLVS